MSVRTSASAGQRSAVVLPDTLQLPAEVLFLKGHIHHYRQKTLRIQSICVVIPGFMLVWLYPSDDLICAISDCALASCVELDNLIENKLSA